MATPDNVKTRMQFANAVSGKPQKKKLPWKLIIPGALLALVGAGYLWMTYSLTPPKGNNLYGICRVYIERHLQFPDTLRIIQFEQRIPEGENPNKPRRIEIDITFSNVDGFGQNMLNTITCGFRTEDKLIGTPWQGLVLERVLFEGRIDHGWADAYYPADKKIPRASDDRSEDLEYFNATLPAIIAYPPDLTLPWHDLKYMNVEDLKDL
jgi:hypothetical protein